MLEKMKDYLRSAKQSASTSHDNLKSALALRKGVTPELKKELRELYIVSRVLKERLDHAGLIAQDKKFLDSLDSVREELDLKLRDVE